MLTHAINKMQPNKAGGPDGLTAECFKYLPDHMVIKLLTLFTAASRLKITPKAWQNNFVKLIFKKGETTAISNYRPIALLNSIFKLWETILFLKLQEELKLPDIIEQSQFGSQKDKGSIDAILSINLIKEANAHLPLYTATIDLSKAYNRVNRSKLWIKLKALGTSPGLLEAIKSTYQFHNEIYKIGGDTSSPNYLRNGLRQGSVLSPILFIIYINDLLKAVQESKEGVFAANVKITKTVTGLMFVDDLHILSNSIEGLTNIVKVLISKAQQEDIIINLKKSAIYLDKAQQEQTNIINNIKNCNTLKHLLIKDKGTYLGAETRPTKMATYQHILARKGKAKAAHSEMTVRGLNQDNLGRATISKIINSTISPTLTYGMEAFPFTKSDYEHIDKTLIDLLSQTTKSSQSAPTWEFYEQHITPPSLTIMRNKITLYIKTTRQQGLTQSLLSSFPHNFLLREIKEIEEDWGIDLKEYMNQYKGIKLVPKKGNQRLTPSQS